MAGKLVLKFKEGEYVLLGDNIVITVERIRGKQTSISFQAPKDMRILRGTIVERCKNESVQQMQAGD